MIRPGIKILSVLFSILLFVLTGCATMRDAGPSSGLVKKNNVTASSPVIEKQSVSVAQESSDIPPSSDYIIGVNDALYVNVNGRPELGSPSVVATGKVQGSRVDGKGYIHLPLAGKIQVAGLTIEQARIKLEGIYRPFIKDPWVVVEVAEYKSQPIYLIGQFKNPGVIYMDRPINLLQGIAMGNGLSDSADLRGARVVRNSRIMTVDIYDLLQEGAFTQNIWLHQGDIIFVPDNKLQNIFVLGEVKRPGPVPIFHNQLSLVQAIAAAGGLNDGGYEERQVRIIRSISTTRGELLTVTVDIKKMLNGETPQFSLAAGDIIYVPRNTLGSWNQTLNEIRPTLQTIGELLNPFVQIKFLSQ